jgi:ketosteroid isomerase-like protein
MGGLLLVPMYVVSADVPSASAAAYQAKAKEEVLRMEREWTIAEDKHDEAALRRILDEKFLVTSGTKSPPNDKEGFIRQMLAGEIDTTASQTLTEPTVIIDGDMAVVIATDTMHGTDKGQAYTAVFRYTATYVHHSGRWLALAEHIVRMPAQQPGP